MSTLRVEEARCQAHRQEMGFCIRQAKTSILYIRSSFRYHYQQTLTMFGDAQNDSQLKGHSAAKHFVVCLRFLHLHLLASTLRAYSELSETIRATTFYRKAPHNSMRRDYWMPVAGLKVVLPLLSAWRAAQLLWQYCDALQDSSWYSTAYSSRRMTRWTLHSTCSQAVRVSHPRHLRRVASSVVHHGPRR